MVFNPTKCRYAQRVRRVYISLSFYLIQDFVSQFSRKCPCVLSRSILQLVILPHNNRKVFGVELVQDTLRDAVRSFVLPPAVAARSPLYNNPAVKEMVDAFLLHGVRVGEKY